tara:strand:+ start:579 stop:785 length:207 start_codon:yes stop_codon:yes gene_type:complete
MGVFMDSITLLKEYWKEFLSENSSYMYRSKILYVAEELDSDNMRVEFIESAEGYEMVYNFLQRKKTST